MAKTPENGSAGAQLLDRELSGLDNLETALPSGRSRTARAQGPAEWHMRPDHWMRTVKEENAGAQRVSKSAAQMGPN